MASTTVRPVALGGRHQATTMRRPGVRRVTAAIHPHAVVRAAAVSPTECDLANPSLPCVAGSAGETQLAALRKVSKVVADTGDIEQVRKYQPVDCTTNPSLILKAASMPEYETLVKEAVANYRPTGREDRPMSGVVDQLAVDFGAELLKIVPGRVSTECDAHLSYDTAATLDKAYRLVDLYAAKGVDLSRLYIKIASTWEGIAACEVLEREGINTNMTLLFSMAQAMACADAGASLISPFVGRIMDWYKKAEGREFEAWEDPGVLSVKRIYKYYKKHSYNTTVMAASFRNRGEILELAGCDNITIAPSLLEELEASHNPVELKLWPTLTRAIHCEPEIPPKTMLDAQGFHELHNADAMAKEKLVEGIQGFSKDQAKLEALLAEIKAAN